MSKLTGRSDELRPAASDGQPNDATLEALSCLMDGELDATHCSGLLKKVCSDPQARRQWTLMHITGDALRSSEVASLHSEAFVARLAAALDAEPAIVAPQASRGSRSFVRRVALPGVAVAAAASVLVFVAVPQLRDPTAGSGAVLTMSPATSSQSAPAQVASTAGEASPSSAGTPNGTVAIQRLPELDAYLAAHREQSGTSMMLRSTPYLRTSATVPR
jgi:sigma-E factor negative regulatory protein RseA